MTALWCAVAGCAARFLAFAAVFIHHGFANDAAAWIARGLPAPAAELLSGAIRSGALGVDVFFCLSAFLITELLRGERARFGEIDALRFLARRAIRIWPLYFAFLVPVMLLGDAFDRTSGALYLSFAGNWSCVLFGYPLSVAAPLWSVSIEEQFYVAWPWLVRRASDRMITTACLVMLGVALATRVLLVAFSVSGVAVWCNTLARMDPIAVGALLSVSLAGRQIRLASPVALFCGAAAAFLALGTWAPPSAVSWLTPLAYTVAALASGAVVAAARPAQRILTNPTIAWLGSISFGLYVFHVLGLSIAGRLARTVTWLPGTMFKPALGLLLTILMAQASWTLLESQFMKLRTKFALVRA